MADCCNKVAVSPTPRQVGNGWVLDAIFADGNAKAIKGFRTESEACEWPGSTRHVIWLRDNHVSPRARAALAAFGYLKALAFVLASVASALIESARQTWGSVLRAGLGSRAVRATLMHLNASAPRFPPIASRLLEQVSEQWSAAAIISSSFRPRVLHVRGSVGLGVLLILTVVVVSLPVKKQSVASDSSEEAQIGAGAPLEHLQSAEATDVPDPIALLIDRLSSSNATVERPVPSPVGQNDMEGEIQVIPPRHDLRAPDSSAIVGVWVPEPGSCSARNLRDGLLPAVISAHGARAGETSCVFKDQRQTERDWRVVANCRNPHENWTTNVRLTVKGDRLVWTSNRGTQAYTRCRPNA
jgi:hypothetical protein